MLQNIMGSAYSSASYTRAKTFINADLKSSIFFFIIFFKSFYINTRDNILKQ